MSKEVETKNSVDQSRYKSSRYRPDELVTLKAEDGSLFEVKKSILRDNW